MDDPVRTNVPATYSNHTSGSDRTPETGTSPTGKPFAPPDKEKAAKKMEENKRAFTKNMSFILLAFEIMSPYERTVVTSCMQHTENTTSAMRDGY